MSRKITIQNAVGLQTTGSNSGVWIDITYMDNLAALCQYTSSSGSLFFDVSLGDPKNGNVATGTLDFGVPVELIGAGSHTFVCNQLPYNYIRSRFEGTGEVTVNISLKSVGA